MKQLNAKLLTILPPVAGLGLFVLLVTKLFSGDRVPNSFSILMGLAIMVTVVLYIAVFWAELKESSAQTDRQIEKLEVRAAQEPDKTKFAWDLARVKPEAYFDRNLSQVRMIFFVAVIVMMVGFAFVMWGVTLAISKPELVKTSYVAAASGIITQFIGVTFMVIYRSTMAQANQL
jgi:hypothetical protein